MRHTQREVTTMVREMVLRCGAGDTSTRGRLLEQVHANAGVGKHAVVLAMGPGSCVELALLRSSLEDPQDRPSVHRPVLGSVSCTFVPGSFLATHPRWLRAQRYAMGTVLAALAVRLLTDRSRPLPAG